MGKSLDCHKCGATVMNIGENVKSVTCSKCVMGMVGMPDEPKQKVSTGRPAGWHFMAEFVDKDGNVFYKGKEQTKLFGTLKPTKVKPPKKKAKRRSKEDIMVAREKEKRAVLKKAVQKQKDFLNHKFGG
tara:strand:- start:11 stop:397 length:387 start_codon:yes stop_codon:yes gene_type:complete